MKLGRVVTGLGIGQIFAFGTTFYLLAVLAAPITNETGWSIATVMLGATIGLVIAGLGSPLVGTLIAGGHGRMVLVASAMLLSAGLVVLAAAHTPIWYFAAWMILGVGMSGGLYNAVFAVLGHSYGAAARPAITFVTLFGGFASTICWPLSTFLVEQSGWRATALIYAAVHLLIIAPLYAFTVPKQRVGPVEETESHGSSALGDSAVPRVSWLIIAAVAIVITLGTSIAALMSMHMFTLLAGVGIAGATAVALAATIGPAQVGARLIELVIGRKHHPLWTLLVSTCATAAGLVMLGAGLLAPALLVVLYGIGLGLSSIASGTVPLALFGQERYARIMGKIALPSLLAQAAAPLVGTALIANFGAQQTLLIVGAAAVVAVVLVIALMLKRLRGSSS